MNSHNLSFGFTDDAYLKKERDKARKIRSSQWWKRKRSCKEYARMAADLQQTFGGSYLFRLHKWLGHKTKRWRIKQAPNLLSDTEFKLRDGPRGDVKNLPRR